MSVDLPPHSIEVRSRAEWREWLTANHTRNESIWLVTYKKRPGAPYVAYAEIVQEALCFGWIDSLPRKLDDARTMLRISPRRVGSGWSKVNKNHIENLLLSGLMHPAGLAKIEAAKKDGSWEKIDSACELSIPADLAICLENHPPATEYFAQFSKSAQRGVLEWIAQAKTATTRALRIRESAQFAAQNQVANQWKRKLPSR